MAKKKIKPQETNKPAADPLDLVKADALGIAPATEAPAIEAAEAPATPAVLIDTVYYVAVHNQEPTPDQEGPFTFQPPKGPQAWKFLYPYSKAVSELKKEAARNIGAGTYYLLP